MRRTVRRTGNLEHMSLGLDLEKILLILVLAGLLLGPERLPIYAEKLAQLTKRLRGWLDEAKDRVKDEMGDDFDAEQWRRLDPRQYDPRRIIRDALIDDAPLAVAPAVTAAAVAPAVTGAAESPSRFDPERDVRYDDEAT